MIVLVNGFLVDFNYDWQNMRLIRYIFVFFAFAILSVSCFAQDLDNAEVEKPKLLTDGFVVMAGEGTIQKLEEGKILFQLAQDITDERVILESGTSIEMLPCSTLEKIENAMGEDDQLKLQLWARVTRFGEKNYLFANYFIPLVKEEKVAEPISEDDNKESGEELSNQEDSVIPLDALEILEPKSVIDIKKLRESVTKQEDVILADWDGFFELEDEERCDWIFKLDSYGRSLSKMQFKVLGSGAFESVVNRLEDSSYRIRYKSVGIVTVYKGQVYILLQRARPVYSYGNFR